ncbi:MAG TPA: MarR family transcriptional regulator [Baekduia sp.]|uniref:MarR family winged helix-turn-helix transcriptional regulator n=1 Tax=Baekduia sp. TaxID=2600305 RepID=UPI002D76E9E3|nr:MarR family transcriptional regulator [Baekduia sp.]HET6508327.1 MarR family transcriptional regulator [Baekduia sp.]
MTGVPEDDEQARRVWAALSSLVRRRDRRPAVSDALGMSFTRVKALLYTSREPRTGRQLATLLAIDAPYVSVIVDDLEQRGFVRREPHPTDRRAKLISVTAAGRRAAAKAERVLYLPPEVLLALPPQDLEALDRIVAKLAGSDPEPGGF